MDIAHCSLPGPSLRSATLFLAVLALATLAPRAVARLDFPFQGAAEECQARHRKPDGPPPGFERIVDEDFLRIEVGAVTLYYPRAELGRKEGLEQLQRITQAALSLQDRWLAWLAGAKPRKGRCNDEDASSLSRWVGGWRTKEVESAASDASATADLLLALGAKAEVAEASRRLSRRLQSSAEPDSTGDSLAAHSFVLVPTREEFVGLTCLLGLENEAQRYQFWNQTTTQRTQVEWRNTTLLALEYFDPSRELDDTSAGMSMDAREQTGLEQHVCSHLATLLVSLFHGEQLDPAIESGMVTNLVIDTLGEDNTRVTGSKTLITEGRSKFVAGGRSEGGKFPRLNADPFWRGDKGRDWFTRVLRVGASRGISKAAELGAGRVRGSFFLLSSALASPEGLLVAAPFLGDTPGTTEIPTEFIADSREFFRAYSSGFVHWLQDQKAKGDSSAAASFARFLAAVARGEDCAASIATVYGRPLATAAPTEPSLEWDFLKSLGVK